MPAIRIPYGVSRLSTESRCTVKNPWANFTVWTILSRESTELDGEIFESFVSVQKQEYTYGAAVAWLLTNNDIPRLLKSLKSLFLSPEVLN